jgi:hypothetical protein
MNHRHVTTILVLILFSCGHIQAFNYAQSELGRRSLCHLKALNTNKVSASGLAVNAFNVLLGGVSLINMPPEMVAYDIVLGMGDSPFSSTNMLYTNGKKALEAMNDYQALDQRERTITAIELAYCLCNDSCDKEDKSVAQKKLEQILLYRHDKVASAWHPKMIEDLAQKLVLANEAGHFSYWSVLFPVKKPLFSFSFAVYGVESLKHLDQALSHAPPSGGIIKPGTLFPEVDLLEIMALDKDLLHKQSLDLQTIKQKYDQALKISSDT